MPNIFKTHALSATLVTQSDLDSAVVAATPKQVKFAGLVLNIPFGKRGSTQTRSTAKGYGARWDGAEWTLPPAKYTPGKEPLEWFRTNGLIAGIRTREYAEWIWDGRVCDIALDVPFADRAAAKQHGAKWDAAWSRWYLPARCVTQAAVDALNKAEAIAGEIDNTGRVVPVPTAAPAITLNQVSAAPTQPRPRPVQGVQRVPITAAFLISQVAERFLPFNLNIKSMIYPGIGGTCVERMSAAESDPRFASRNRHWLAGIGPEGQHLNGVFVCFTEVPWEFDDARTYAEQEAIAVVAVEVGPNHTIKGGTMDGYHINDFLSRGAVTLADSTSAPLQCVITRQDAIRLYEDLANTVGFKPYPAPQAAESAA